MESRLSAGKRLLEEYAKAVEAIHQATLNENFAQKTKEDLERLLASNRKAASDFESEVIYVRSAETEEKKKELDKWREKVSNLFITNKGFIERSIKDLDQQHRSQPSTSRTLEPAPPVHSTPQPLHQQNLNPPTQQTPISSETILEHHEEDIDQHASFDQMPSTPQRPVATHDRIPSQQMPTAPNGFSWTLTPNNQPPPNFSRWYDNTMNDSRADLPYMQLKLSKVELPTFNGDIIQWPAFRDQFRDMIDENPRLTDLVKLHQLRTHLTHDALETVNGYKFTGANYAAAWADLKRRYDRNDLIIEEYIRRFIELPVLSQYPHGKKYTEVVDATHQMLRALPNWGIDVTSWDPILKFMIQTKLDDNTRRLWKQHIGRREQVPLAELIDFLEIRALEVQPTQSDKVRQMFLSTDNKRQMRKVHHIETKACVNCRGEHPLYRCDKFKTLSPHERVDLVKKTGTCYRCLGKHEIGKCKLGNCPECNGPHNRLLCFKTKGGHEQEPNGTMSLAAQHTA